MGREPREQQEADAKRITGPSRDEARARLERELDAATRQLQDMGIAPEMDEMAPRAAGGAVLGEGEMSLASRERLANRIGRLTAALQRVDEGTYGECTICGGPVSPGRLAALPEADTCLFCQETLERIGSTEEAA